MQDNQQARVRIGMQKSGRLAEASFALLDKCGVKITRRSRSLFYHSENFPLDILLLRDDDIPYLVYEGLCDIGIAGDNVIKEKAMQLDFSNNGLKSIRPLGFGFCRLSIAGPTSFSFNDPSALAGKRIATSYPNLLGEYLATHNVKSQVYYMNGSVEIAPGLGMSDLICDLVSTGATLQEHRLKELSTLLHSQAQLIQTPKTLAKDKQAIIDRLITRMASAAQAHESKYVMLHAPTDALAVLVDLLPGAEHPTILPLDGEKNKVAVHAVCRESVFWETLESLKAAGASSILILPIEKMMA